MSEFKIKGRPPKGDKITVGWVLPRDLVYWLRDQSVVRQQAMSEIVRRLLEEEREKQAPEALEREEARA